MRRVAALGLIARNALVALVGLPWQRRLAHGALKVPAHPPLGARVRKAERRRSLDERLASPRPARGGESLDKLLPEAFGLVCVQTQRVLGMRPFDVQLAAGVVMHQGGLAELATGEGKTLTASLPVFLNALEGKGVHVATVNDYLARRDAEWMQPIYKGLGLTIGVLQQQMAEPDRRAVYQCDVTYGTASEFGFDFLRDRLKGAGAKGSEAPFWAPWVGGSAQNKPAEVEVQRPHHFALVDEADNVFVDEARTPLIISEATRHANAEEKIPFFWADGLAKQMTMNEHFVFDQKKQKLELTGKGKQLMRYSNPPRVGGGGESSAMDKLEERVEQALQAHYRFRRDQHYMVDKGEIVIIDEFTGRKMPNRQWREGLHQAIEAKENVTIHKPSDHAAQITYQSYFRLYKKLAGMTGTAKQNRFEVRRVYKLWVVCVPTNRPVCREHWPDRVFPNEDAKFTAVVEEVLRLKAMGRAVLIGTRSVDKSEKLSNGCAKPAWSIRF